jgi:two-component system CheB/CheR fusion protein
VSNDFEVVDAKAKLFRCVRRASLPLALSSRGGGGGGGGQPSARSRRLADIEAAQAQLMQAYVPPSVLVDDERNVLHVFGDGSGLLRVPAGAATSDISRMLPSAVASVTISVILRVLKGEEGDIVIGETTPRRAHGIIRVEGRAIGGGTGRPAHVLLSFRAQGAAQVPSGSVSHTALEASAQVTERLRELEDEILHTRENLQTSIEELEASNEELQAANEELLASNEELQSTNEELQSVNEELYTVNAEHQEKIEILRKLNADLDVMARATGIPMLFLDNDLAITRYTPAMTEFVPITVGDVGRPLDHFTVRLDAPWLHEALQEVARTGLPFQREVVSVPWLPDGGGTRRFLVKGLPYDAGHGERAGVVLTLLDITAVREARAWQSVIDGLVQHVAVLDEHGVITNVNRAWNDFARRNGDPHLRRTSVGSNYLDVTESSEDPTAAEALLGLRAVLAGERASFRLEYPCHSPNQRRFFVMDAVRLDGPGGGAVVSHMETTTWVPDADQLSGAQRAHP